MKANQPSIPGYRIVEYLLVIQPHEELRQRILAVKKEFSESYRVNFNGTGRCSASLVSFRQYEMMEERIVNRLKILAMGFPAFKVELKDFGSFPSHSIHINVTSKLPIQNLVRQIRTESQRLMKLNDDNKPHFMMEPHIAIASKLKPWQYEKGWLEYSQKHFTGRFIADSMTLLRKDEGEARFQLVKRFAFENLPVATKQGELFG